MKAEPLARRSDRRRAAAFNQRCIAPHKKCELCPCFLSPDPAALGGVIRVLKCGFPETTLRI